MGPYEPINQEQIYFCAFCDGPGSTRHHLVPRKIGRAYGMIGSDRKLVIRLCRECHDEVHYYFSHWELAVKFRDHEALKAELKRRKESDPIKCDQVQLHAK